MGKAHHAEKYKDTTKPFENFMTETLDIPHEDWEKQLSKVTIRNVRKDEFLSMQGDVCRYIYYTETGILRMYSIDSGGKEHTVQIAPESWMVFDRLSLYMEVPSKFYIQAVEDSVVVCIKKGFLENIAKTYPQSAEKNLFVLNRYIMMLQYRVNMLLSATAEERYLDFLKRHGKLANRLPLYMIASYLGMSPENLSRIRSELAK